MSITVITSNIKSNLHTSWYYVKQHCISEVSLSIYGLSVLHFFGVSCEKLIVLTF
jgi:hypothetical protein